MTETTTDISKPRRIARRLLRACGWIVLGAILVGITLWSMLAVCFASLHGGSPRYVLAAVVVAATIAGIIFIRSRKYRLAAPVLIFLIVLAWYFSLRPSNNRDWSPDVAHLASADIDGNRVIVHNVRNFDYRSETDFTPAWEERTYDLDHLKTVDFILVYWGSPAIAHAIVSFVFDDGQCLAVSIETRKEKTESYSALQGFFRQYELIYVFADERDVLRLRTDFRNEDVYLYRSRITPLHAKAVFLSYLATANKLRDQPEWYNALTTNCATGVLPHAQAGGAKGQLSWEILLSGYAARQAYRNGGLDDDMPFEQLQSRSHINDAAHAAGKSADFSQQIRAGLPVPQIKTVVKP